MVGRRAAVGAQQEHFSSYQPLYFLTDRGFPTEKPTPNIVFIQWLFSVQTCAMDFFFLRPLALGL